MNIQEDYVSFETAKLLKEKGFNPLDCGMYYSIMTGKRTTELLTSLIACPTLQMVMKWLREEYNIYISIQPDFPSDKDYKMCWCWSVNILHENCICMKGCQCYIETYEEAVEAALKYSLENLI